MDIGSFLIGIGGLFVAGLSVWLNYRGRTSLYRERLYSKQLEVYPEVIRSYILLDEAMLSLIIDCEMFKRLHTEDHARWLVEDVEKATERWHAFRDMYQCSLPLLSKEFADRIQQYSEWAGKAFRVVDAIRLNQECKDNYSERLSLRAEVLQSARKDLGTDPLTQEALNLIGEIKPTRDRK